MHVPIWVNVPINDRLYCTCKRHLSLFILIRVIYCCDITVVNILDELKGKITAKRNYTSGIIVPAPPTFIDENGGNGGAKKVVLH